MRRYSHVGVIATASAALTLSMVLVNIAFEAAGSVPDMEGCGFLAGSLLSLALLYPLLAGVCAARAARTLMGRGADQDTVTRSGAAIGACGSGLYFGFGTLTVMRSSQGSFVSPNVWALAAVFVLACAWAGRIGPQFRAAGLWPQLLRRSGN